MPIENAMTTAILKDEHFWTRIARKYARDPIKDMEGYERSLRVTQGYLKATDRVLEVGCGTGSTALRLAPGVGHLRATDFAPGMIEIAEEKLRQEKTSNLEFEAATLGQCQKQGQSFDAVLAFNVLHLLRDLPVSLTQIHSLLKPGGLLISKTACVAEMNIFIRMAIPLAQAIGQAPYVNAFKQPQLREAFETAGFEIVEWSNHGSNGKDIRVYVVARKGPKALFGRS